MQILTQQVRVSAFLTRRCQVAGPQLCLEATDSAALTPNRNRLGLLVESASDPHIYYFPAQHHSGKQLTQQGEDASCI